jgi:hypothetical protein
MRVRETRPPGVACLNRQASRKSKIIFPSLIREAVGVAGGGQGYPPGGVPGTTYCIVDFRVVIPDSGFPIPEMHFLRARGPLVGGGESCSGGGSSTPQGGNFHPPNGANAPESTREGQLVSLVHVAPDSA